MAHEAAALLDLVDVLVCPPVRGPLPHVADHVLVAELGGGELRDGPRPAPPVRLRVLGGEGPGPDVGAVLATRQPLEEDKYFLIPHVTCDMYKCSHLVAPGEEPVLLARPARHLPLRLRGQPLARPLAVRHRVVPGDVNLEHCENITLNTLSIHTIWYYLPRDATRDWRGQSQDPRGGASPRPSPEVLLITDGRN